MPRKSKSSSDSPLDYKVITGLVSVYLKVYEVFSYWKAPEDLSKIMVFANSALKRVAEGKIEGVILKEGYEIEKISRSMVELIYSVLRIGRFINQYRVSLGKGVIDWNKEAIALDRKNIDNG